MLPREFAEKVEALLSDKVEIDQAKNIASTLRKLVEQLLANGNLSLLVMQINTFITAVLDEINKKTLAQIDFHQSPLNKDLLKLLSKYTDKDSEKNVILEKVLAYIKEDIENSSYRYHLMNDGLRELIYEELEQITTKKELDEVVFFFDFEPFLEKYVDLILNVESENDRKIKTPLKAWLDEILEPKQALIDQANLLLKSYKDDLTYQLFIEITNFRQTLISLKSQIYNAKLEEIPKFILENNVDKYANLAYQETEALFLEVEDNWMNDFIEKWLNNKPKDLRSLLDLDAIKNQVRYYAAYNENVDKITEEIEARRKFNNNLNESPRFLTDYELTNFSSTLANYLNAALNEGFTVLVTPNTEILLNAENRKYYLAAYLFNEFFGILPNEIKNAFLKKVIGDKFTPEELCALGLKEWKQGDATIQLCYNFIQNENNFNKVKHYIEVQNKKSVGLSNKKLEKNNKEKLAQIQEICESKKSNDIDKNKIDLLLKYVLKNNEKLFTLFLNKCNVPTLEDLKLKLTVKTYLDLVNNRLKEMKQAATKLSLFSKSEQPVVQPEKICPPAITYDNRLV